MKYKFILLIVISILIKIHGYAQPTEQLNADKHFITSCPDFQEKDIFLVGYFLTNHQNKIKRKKTGINTYTFDQSEIGELDANTPEKLREYWEKRGVIRVTKPRICSKINEVLKGENQLQDYEKAYRRLYYIVKDKYLIMYLPKDTMIDGPDIPILVMDSSFNIITYF